MNLHYAFDGDEDGPCALQRLRVADRRQCLLVTDVKRDLDRFAARFEALFRTRT